MNDESVTDSDHLAIHPDARGALGSPTLPKARSRWTACKSFVGRLKRLSKHRRHSDIETMRHAAIADNERSAHGLQSPRDTSLNLNKDDERGKADMNPSYQYGADPLRPRLRQQPSQPTSLRASLPLTHISPLSPPPRHPKAKRATVNESSFAAALPRPPSPIPRTNPTRRSLALRLSLDVDQHYNPSHSPSTLSVVTSGSDGTSRRHPDIDGPLESDHVGDDDEDHEDDSASLYTLSRPRLRPTSMLPMPFPSETLSYLKQRHQSYSTTTSSAASATAPLSPGSPSSPLADDERRVSLLERRRRRSPLSVPDDEHLKLALQFHSSSLLDEDYGHNAEDENEDEDRRRSRRNRLAHGLSERDLRRLSSLEREASREDAMCSLEGKPKRSRGVDLDKAHYEAVVTRSMHRQPSLPDEPSWDQPLQRSQTDAPQHTSRTADKDTKRAEDSLTNQGTALRTPSLIYFPSSPSSVGSMNG